MIDNTINALCKMGQSYPMRRRFFTKILSENGQRILEWDERYLYINCLLYLISI